MDNSYNPDIHHRRSIRLRGYDYKRAGAYFITICTYNRICAFGEVIDARMHLNDQGRIVEAEWQQTAVVRTNVALDAFVVMPNHFHGIIVLIDQDAVTQPATPSQPLDPPSGRARRPASPQPGSLGAIIAQFKSIVTKRINRSSPTISTFAWQRNYFERIVRSEDELNRVRQYITDNPARWMDDQHHPKRSG